MPSTPVVDLHSHVFPIQLADDIRRRPRHYGMTVETGGGRQQFVRDDGHSTPMYPQFEDPEAKVAVMDARGIDISVVSVTGSPPWCAGRIACDRWARFLLRIRRRRSPSVRPGRARPRISIGRVRGARRRAPALVSRTPADPSTDRRVSG